MLHHEASNSSRKRVSFLLTKAGWVLILVGIAWAAYASGHIAVSDYLYSLDTPDSVRQAIRLEPGNADYHALLAEHQEGLGADPDPELARAIALSPLTSRYMTRAALRAEVDRDFVRTEKLLAGAARVDHKLEPRWALLSFYFRRGSETGKWPAEFWPTFSEALSISSPEESNAIFQLAWAKTEDAGTILQHVPNEPGILRRYLDYLTGTQRLLPAGVVAQKLAKDTDESNVPVLVEYCEQAQRTDMPSAVAVWNILVDRKLVQGNRLDPAAGAILSNKEFALNNPSRGFDWKTTPVEGVVLSHSGAGQRISIRLDGNEPEDCILLSQIMPVLPGRTYRIEYKFSTGETVIKGLRWEVSGEAGSPAVSQDLESAAESEGSLEFQVSGHYAQLVLHYQRPLGSVRAEGNIVIHGLADHILK